MDVDSEIMAGFLDEGGKCLADLNAKLLEAERGNVEPELVCAMFRAAHSMKGLSGMLHLRSFGAVTHAVETVLDRIRNDRLTFTQPVVDALFRAFDQLSSLHQMLAAGNMEQPDVTAEVTALEAVLGKPQQAEEAAGELGPLPDFIEGRLDVDDVLESLVARQNGRRVYLLRFSLREMLLRRVNVPQLLEALGRTARVHRVISMSGPQMLFPQPLSVYDVSVCLLLFCEHPLPAVLASCRMPECEYWELCGTQLLRQKYDGAPSQAEELTLLVREDMRKHLTAWMGDAREELEALDGALMRWEQELSSAECLAETFRMLHRLKGAGASMGFTAVARVAHEGESLLAKLRDAAMQPTSEIMQALYAAKDFLQECVNRVAAGRQEAPDASALLTTLGAQAGQLASTQSLAAGADKNLLLEASARGETIWEVDVRLQAGAPMADLRCRLILKNLVALGRVVASSPTDAELAEAAENAGRLRVLFTTACEEETVRQAVEIDQVARARWVQLRMEAPAKTAENASSGSGNGAGVVSDTVRVETERLDSLLNASGELLIAKSGIAGLADQLNMQLMEADIRGLESLLVAARRSGNTGLNADRLNRLERWVGQVAQIQECSDNLRNAVIALHRHAGQIQHGVMKMRMVPVGPLFQRYQRIVRDVCKARERRARLVLKGETTELDKKLVDELSDPLTHMVRNSVDHGLESPQQRVAAGKPEEGTVSLEAFHEGGRICIRISDDGQGLNVERIRAKAIEKGIVTSAAAERMSEVEAMQLIFLPGFSTAEKVTDISGRGVGMDIVRNKVMQLKGTVDVTSVAGQGATFTIRLPLTLAMIDALLVGFRDARYAVPLETVREIIEIPAGDIHEVQGHGRMIDVRGRVIPYVELPEALGIDGARLDGDLRRCLITRTAGCPLALAVDRVFRQEEIVVKPLTDEFAGITGISGATILGDGGVALILDMEALGQGFSAGAPAVGNVATPQAAETAEAATA